MYIGQNNDSGDIAHISVMVSETLLAFSGLKSKSVFLDATFGCGGHTRAILNNLEDSCVIGIDRDHSIIKYANMISQEFDKRFVFYHGTMCDTIQLLKNNNVIVDGVIIDCGISLLQLEDINRGFSYNVNGSLKMTMGFNKFNAYDVVNNYSVSQLCHLFRCYGEEPCAKQIANAIVIYRKDKAIETTLELKNIVASVINNKIYITKVLSRIFQAIRIEVNDELQQLSNSLLLLLNIVRPNGIVVVISFHSLEDRIVKQCIKAHANYKTSKLILPSTNEIEQNHMARSAKMRIFTIQK